MYDPSRQKLLYTEDGSNFYSLSGINNFSISSNVSIKDPFLLGGNYSSSQVDSPTQIEINIDFDLIQNNSFLKYTGSSPISFFICGGSVYGHLIKNLYLNNYSINLTPGDLPKVSTKFIAYGECILYSGAFSSTSVEPINSIEIPKLSDLIVSGTDNTTPTWINPTYYQIYSVNYSITSPRCVVYNATSNVPDIVSIKPLIINSTINSKILESAAGSSISYYNNASIAPDFFLNFYIVKKGLLYNTCFPSLNSRIISHEIKMSSNNFLELKREYLGYYGV
jgi:hypothetical protein